jgi:hypothetical protein
MKKLLVLLFGISCLSLFSAVQYNVKGNQGWLTFDSITSFSVDVTRSGKDKDHHNFIDAGKGIQDYGWYNLNTNEYGSLKDVTVTFTLQK